MPLSQPIDDRLQDDGFVFGELGEIGFLALDIRNYIPVFRTIRSSFWCGDHCERAGFRYAASLPARSAKFMIFSSSPVSISSAGFIITLYSISMDKHGCTWFWVCEYTDILDICFEGNIPLQLVELLLDLKQIGLILSNVHLAFELTVGDINSFPKLLNFSPIFSHNILNDDIEFNKNIIMWEFC